MHRDARADRQSHAEDFARRAGYQVGGAVSDDAEDKRLVARGVRQHEDHDHKGEKPTNLRLRAGGAVPGGESPGRLDRHARGGKVHNLNVVIHNSNPGERQQAAQKGMQLGAQMGARAAAAHMPPPGAGAPAPMPPGAGAPMPHPPMAAPPGAMPGRPMAPPPGGMMASGGMVKVNGYERRRAGGRVE